jgi:UDP-4-amino-4,6-dideoxy-N-acetyl-beta-L-altrosamine transaminase
VSQPLRRAEEKPDFLPYGRQVIEEDDIAAVTAALRGDFLTTGPLIARFEEALAKTVHAEHAVVCSNGTAALYMAARALGLGPGSKVIVPSVTFLATASAPHLAGAEIVFADVDPDSGLMRPRDLEEALARTGRAHALFNVHLNGQCGEAEEIAEIARRHGLMILDDACHAIGTHHTAAGNEHIVGDNAFSDLTVFSFHPVKTVTMGEGGAVTANDPTLAAALRLHRNHGMSREPSEFANLEDGFETEGRANPWYYELIEPGFNWRAPDIQCALGLTQLAKLPRFAARRRALAATYDALLAPYAPRLRPIGRIETCRPTWHLYAVLIDFDACGFSRAEAMTRLAAEGIGSQVHYYPLHRQRYFAARYGSLTLPGADRYYARVLSLPFFSSMAVSDAARVADTLARILKL